MRPLGQRMPVVDGDEQGRRREDWLNVFGVGPTVDVGLELVWLGTGRGDSESSDPSGHGPEPRPCHGQAAAVCPKARRNPPVRHLFKGHWLIPEV